MNPIQNLNYCWNCNQWHSDTAHVCRPKEATFMPYEKHGIGQPVSVISEARMQEIMLQALKNPEYLRLIRSIVREEVQGITLH